MRKLTRLENEWLRIEKFEELRATLFMISNWMVLPLYFLFWVCDLIYVPELKWEFLALRSTVIPACLIVQWGAKRVHAYHQSQWLALFFIVCLAGVINTMVFMIDSPLTPYYAGLNLVAIGSLTFIPWERRFFLLGFGAIFAPYFIGQFIRIDNGADLKGLLVHAFFIFSTGLIAFIIRMFNEKLRIKEYRSRVMLSEEIGNRDSIIIEKTDEAVRLNALSRQFSPQVVDAIKSGQIKISNTIRRVEVCSVFIDIVSSTEAVVELEKEKVHNVVSTFMDDTIKILLKYDITIDKFLGDGVLAFANDPVSHVDFAERVVLAALEVQQKVAMRSEFYEQNWRKPLQIRCGIAIGQANVGFYGNQKYFQTYTAIGPVINLASRLCSAAQPDQILVSKELAEHLHHDDFNLIPVEDLFLKGFKKMSAFELRSVRQNLELADHETECPSCNQGIMAIDLNEDGLYILKCNKCGFEPDDCNQQTTIKKIPRAS